MLCELRCNLLCLLVNLLCNMLSVSFMFLVGCYWKVVVMLRCLDLFC